MYDSLTVYCDPPTYRTSAATYVESQIPYDRLFEGPLRLHFTSSKNLWNEGLSLDYTIIEGVASKFLSVVNDINVVKGDDVVLPCHVTGISQPVVSWYKEGLEIH
jgi:hypothetical protein